MKEKYISIKGKVSTAKSLTINGYDLIISGRFWRFAKIHDEEWLAAHERNDAEHIIEALKGIKGIDVFTFRQKINDVGIKYHYNHIMENYAVASTQCHESWMKEIHYTARKNIKKSIRKGIETRVVPYGKELIKGIHAIYNEEEVRQGRKFWHYGKTYEEVERDNATYKDRSVFIGVFDGNQLIGFLKMVIDSEVASIMQILAKRESFPKRPNNALLSKAVDICAERGIRHLIYGEYTYGNKLKDSLTDFKRKNGFRKILYPRYYVPLTFRGEIALKMKLHRGLDYYIPEKIAKNLRTIRSNFYSYRLGQRNTPK